MGLKPCIFVKIRQNSKSGSLVQQGFQRNLPSRASLVPDVQVPGLLSQQPGGSQVKLTKSATAFRVYIPPMGFRLAQVPILLFGIAWNSFITFWTGGAMIPLFTTPFPANLISIPFLLFSLPFWGAGLMMILAVVFPLYGRVQLHIDQEISLTYELFGLKFKRPRPSQRQAIDQLKRIHQHYQRDSEGDRVSVSPALVIRAGTQEYKLGQDGILSEAEVDWLAQELSVWLNLPLETEGRD